jgi:hypothetical protein
MAPIFWLAVEVFLLRAVFLDCGGLFGSCHGKDCSEISGLMGIWGLPISIIVGLAFEALPIEGCSKVVSVVAAVSFCLAGTMQWYFIIRFYTGGGLTKLFQRISHNPLFDRDRSE